MKGDAEKTAFSLFVSVWKVRKKECWNCMQEDQKIQRAG